MEKVLWIRRLICFSIAVIGSHARSFDNEGSALPVHIIRPPVRCPDGMKPDANGKCRVVWGKSVGSSCFGGVSPDDEQSLCGETETTGYENFGVECSGDCLYCPEGEDCRKSSKLAKRDLQEVETQDHISNIENSMKRKNTEIKSGKKSDRSAKAPRSKHFIIMLKKKKLQMMKPKPPPPPPDHHHPPHHHPESEEPEEEEETPAEDQPAPERLFFGDDPCANDSDLCQPYAEVLDADSRDREFKEWSHEPPDLSASSESSESSDFSSSSSSAGSESESENRPGSDETEDEILEKAIKIKLLKIFQMKQRYGPTLRRWLLDRLREYEDSLGH